MTLFTATDIDMEEGDMALRRSTTPPHSVAYLNRHAVHLLREGAYEQARATLQVALTSLRRQLEEEEEANDEHGSGAAGNQEESKEEKSEDEDSSDEDGHHDARLLISSKRFEVALSLEDTTVGIVNEYDDTPVDDDRSLDVVLVNLDDGQHPVSTTYVTEAYESSVYYFINKALDFTTRITRDDVDDNDVNCVSDRILLSSSINSARATSVLCYNIAMTYHLQVVRTLASTLPPHEALLRKAARLYNLVLDGEIFADDRSGSTGRVSSSSSSSSIRIGAALWNNKGHAHHCLGEFEHVKMCVRALSRWTHVPQPSAPSPAPVPAAGEESSIEARRTANNGRGTDAAATTTAATSSHHYSRHVALGDAALPLALNVHLHRSGPINPASSA